MLLTNLAISGLPGGLWNWRPGEPNELENWRTVEPNDDTNSTIPEQSTMLGLINFNGDHSTMETQVLTDSDKAPLGLMSVMDDDVGIELDSPGSVGAAPHDKGFVALDQFLLPNATKPCVQSVETFQNDTFPDSKERTGITFSQLADIDKKALTLLFVPSGLFIENP